MTWWKVLPLAALVLLLLSLIRVGAGVAYGADGLEVKLRIGPLRIRLFPRKEREKKPPGEKKPGKAKPPRETEESPQKGGPLDQVRQYLPLICEAAGALLRRIRIDTLRLDLTIPGLDDPTRAALSYGRANAIIGMFLPLIEQNFEVKDRRVRANVDFNAEGAAICVNAALSLRLGQLFGFAVRYGVKFLRARPSAPSKQKEAI